ncbi:hypothetical protein KUTeg_005087 [Tegillarca granosa]|uniref:Uncharacterized protein n=1 Tax=Tegillarca granosa TaxID=220873 RepID=A0ABQ9FIS0_TEGGR|nr:hypothetical protein KUTeg_005087 [Tegillarca granosa]
MEEAVSTEIQRDTIRALENEFLEYLDPVPIIDFVPSFPNEVCERIRECTHRREKVAMLIKHVIEVKDDNSTLNVFISALEENGYRRFIDKFEGKNQSNHLSDDFWEFLIKMMRGDMQKHLYTPDLVPELVYRRCLTEEDEEAIERVRENRGEIASCRELFVRLPRLKTRWAWEFFETLKDTNHNLLISKANLAPTDDELTQKALIIPCNSNRQEEVHPRTGDNCDTEDYRENTHVLYHRGEAAVSDDMETNCKEFYGSSSSDNDYADSDYEKGFEKGEDEESEKGQAPKVILRNYQKELAENALRGVNTIICADTGSGKTWVCLHIVKQHLDKMNGKGKVVFMAKTNPLVQQQYQIFHKYIPEYSVIGLTASIGIGKAENEKDAVQYMLNICANMDVDEISTVQKYKDEMRKYVPVPSEEHVKMAIRYTDPCAKAIKQVMLKIEEILQEDIIKNIRDGELRGRLTLLLRNIPSEHQSKKYQKWCTDYYYDALEVNYLMNIEHVVEYLDDKFSLELQQEKGKMNRFEKSLLRLYKGMTEEEKKQLLEKFRAGDVKLLVATSVGSEGIDVPECNIVLKYNYSGNEISIIQMRGR